MTVTNTAGPFKVTSPNTGVSWAGGSPQTITWDVANTTLPPVSVANVNIRLSTDGGQTFPTILAANTPNDGSELVTIPGGPSTTARVKVEAVGNIFFDLSDANFSITGSPALALNTVVSRKTHTGVGDFDIPMPLVAPFGVECRTSGGNHMLVFTFTNTVVSGSASVSSGTGSVSGSPTFSGSTMTVNLTGVTDIQAVGITLANVMDNFAQVLPNTVVTANFLVGDVNGNKSVNATDVGSVKGQSGVPASAANFKNDLNVSGGISATDVALEKSASGHSIP